MKINHFSMQLDLNTVEAAADRGFTSPGTIDVFGLDEIKFDKVNEKEIFEITFGRKDDSFRETFYLTEKASPRFVYLWEKLMGTEAQIPQEEAGVIAALKGKKLGLKVGGRIGTIGKGYPSLPFSGFACAVDQLSELSFSTKEKVGIREALAAQTQQTAAEGSTDAAANTNGSAEADDLPF